ncbi:MAG: efflux RND transporter periplasmic adaptor subunit [Alcaligenaceae bacterium]|nr:efflux RND transporter periplasmic adaptor subunit [Alcaligenaceae bacterium]
MVGKLYAVCLIFLMLSACQRDHAATEHSRDENISVTVVTLKEQSVTLTRELTGRAIASVVAEIRPQADGIVQQLSFQEGGIVHAGQTLYQLDDALYRADVASNQASLNRSLATLEAARLNARRSAALFRHNAVSRQDNETAQSALKEAEADVALARATLERSRIMLGYTRIVAPVSGKIGKSSVTQGALVNANQSVALARVQQLDPIHIDLNQSSTELLQLRKALRQGSLNDTRAIPVTVLLEDGTVYPHTGQLIFSESSVDPETGRYTLRVTVPNPDDILLPGTYVRAVISYGERKQAILAPQQSIVRDARGTASAHVVKPDGTVEQRTVRTDRTLGDQWLIDEGLQAGDRVIVEGLQKLRAGVVVHAAEAKVTSD